MSASPAAGARLAAALLAALAAVLLTVASIPFPFGPLVVALVLMAARAVVRRSGGALAEPVGRALAIVALLAALVGLALAASYGVGGEAAPREPATPLERGP